MPARAIRRWAGAAAAALAAALAAGLAAAPADDLAAELSKGRPDVAALLRQYPGIERSWRDEPEVWPKVLLHAPPIPGTPWRVHDFRRPQPPIVTPPMSACAGSPPPADAVVLYDGRGPRGFAPANLDHWIDHDGVLTADAAAFGLISSRAAFGDVQVHLEFREPDPPAGDWQYRGNSGLFLMGRYEIQILDSYRNPTFPDGMLGALFGEVPPIANAALPPGHWQCLDVVFTAPRFNGSALTSPARATVVLNGVVVQADAAFSGPTHFAELRPYVAHPGALPLSLQNHGDGKSRVAFRAIWARPLHGPPL